MPNKELAEELYEPIIREFEKRKVYSSFIDNIWGPDLADVKLISKFNKGIHLLLCVIDIYGKYAWVIHLKGKKDAAIGNVSQKVLKESDGKQKTEYGQINAISFTIGQWNHGCKITIQKYIQNIMMENLLLLKDLL